jgi:hypothetical protein
VISVEGFSERHMTIARRSPSSNTVGFAVEHAMALLAHGEADRLGQVAFARGAGPGGAGARLGRGWRARRWAPAWPSGPQRGASRGRWPCRSGVAGGRSSMRFDRVAERADVGAGAGGLREQRQRGGCGARGLIWPL